jgi:hypothetical protein
LIKAELHAKLLDGFRRCLRASEALCGITWRKRENAKCDHADSDKYDDPEEEAADKQRNHC